MMAFPLSSLWFDRTRGSLRWNFLFANCPLMLPVCVLSGLSIVLWELLLRPPSYCCEWWEWCEWCE